MVDYYRIGCPKLISNECHFVTLGESFLKGKIQYGHYLLKSFFCSFDAILFRAVKKKIPRGAKVAPLGITI